MRMRRTLREAQRPIIHIIREEVFLSTSKGYLNWTFLSHRMIPGATEHSSRWKSGRCTSKAQRPKSHWEDDHCAGGYTWISENGLSRAANDVLRASFLASCRWITTCVAAFKPDYVSDSFKCAATFLFAGPHQLALFPDQAEPLPA